MKIVVIENAYRGALGEEPSVTAYPDTCLFRNNDAFYMSNVDSSYALKAGLYFKIIKIGKCVEPDFAFRYVSEIGVAFNFIDKSFEQKLIDSHLNTLPAYAYDRSFAVSNQTIEFDPQKLMRTNLRLKVADTEFAFTPQSFRFSLESMIASATRNMTIKIGDLLFCPYICLEKAVATNVCVDGFLNDNHLLKCIVK